MAQDEDLSPATREEVISSLSFALRFTGRKRTHKADDFMARIAAEHLADHLARSGLWSASVRPRATLRTLIPTRPA